MRRNLACALISACLPLLILSGCTSKPKDAIPTIATRGPVLPQLPDRYARIAPDPGGFRDGVDVRITAIENREWGKQCVTEKTDFARWYKRQRAATLKP